MGEARSEIFVLVRIHLTCLLTIKMLVLMNDHIVTRTGTLLLLCSGVTLLDDFLVSLISFVDLGPHSVQ